MPRCTSGTPGDNRCFCTAIFGVLTPDGEGFTLALARGGHAAPLIMRANGTAGQVSVPGGPLIGIWDDAEFTTTTIRLSPETPFSCSPTG